MTMHKPEQIRRRPYEILQAKGCPPDSELRYWLNAELKFDEEHKPQVTSEDFPCWAREPAAMQAL